MKKKKTSLCTRITIFSLSMTAISVVLWVLLFKANTLLGEGNILAANVDTSYLNEPKKENVSLLFAGVDKDGLRTDSIIYIKYDTINNKMYMMSIPRDTYTTNPYATYKINSIYYGGKYTKEFVSEVESLLDVNIDYYAIINFNVMYDVIDKIGGLKITLEDEIWKLDKEKNEWYLAFPKGEQTLNASQVETLVRNRDYPDGDLTREKVQRQVITTLIENMMSSKNILKLPNILGEVLESTNTNVTIREAMKYVTELKEMDTKDIVSSNMPILDISYVVNGVDCVVVNEEEARRIIDEEWIYTEPATNIEDDIEKEIKY